MITKILNFFAILWINIKRNFIKKLFIGIGLTFSITILITGNIITHGLETIYEKSLLNKIPINEIKLEGNVKTIITGNILDFKTIKRERKVSNIQKDFIKLIRNMDEVDKTIPITKALFPVSVHVIAKPPIKNNQAVIIAEPPIIGIPNIIAERYIKKYTDEKEIENYRSNFPNGFKKHNNIIPILIPRYIEEIGKNIMKTNTLPEINLSSLNRFFELNLFINKSTIIKEAKPKKIINLRGKIAGFVDINLTPGIAIPQEEIEHAKKIILPRSEGEGYESVIIKLKTGTHIKEFENKLEKYTKKENITISKSSLLAKLSKHIQDFIKSFELLIYFIGSIILLIAGVAIFYGFSYLLLQREKEMKLYRFFGSSVLVIIMLLTIEAALIGLFYGSIGYYISYCITNYINTNTGNLLILLPETIKTYLFREELNNIFVFVHSKNLIFVLIATMFSIVTSLIISFNKYIQAIRSNY